MKYLIDTNVLSELRKGPRCHPGVTRWRASIEDTQVSLSVLTVGEIRRGVDLLKFRQDNVAANALERWLDRLQAEYHDSILPVDRAVAEQWGRLNVPDPVSSIDGLLAATALVHGLTLVTRNVRHVARCGVALLNPFDG